MNLAAAAAVNKIGKQSRMSTAPAGPLPDPPPAQPGQMPGPWALLAATAVGGVIGTRLGPTPLVLAAGAAALALLQQKKSASPVSAPQAHAEPPPVEQPPASPQPGFVAGATTGTGWHPISTPQPPAENAPSRLQMHESMQNQVEAWLSRQMQRDKEEPVIELSLQAPDVAATPPPAGDAFFSTGSTTPDQPTQSHPVQAADTDAADDYRPGPFLLDEAESPPETAELVRSQNHDVFARLTAPKDMYVVLETAPSQQPSSPQKDAPPALTQQPPPFAPSKPALSEPAPSPFAFASAVSAPVLTSMPAPASRPLNLEPLPSLTDSEPGSLPAGALFFSTPPPMPQVELDPQPAASSPTPSPTEATPAPVFQGAAFPDAIEVPMAFSLDEIPAVLFKEKTPAAKDSPIDSNKSAEVPSYLPTGMPFFKVHEPVREIEVQLAAPGEASFDSPQDAMPKDPWQAQMEAAAAATTAPSAPELDAATGLLTSPSSSPDSMPGSPFWDTVAMGTLAQPEPPAPPHGHSIGPVVDAEILIKARVQEDTRPVFVAKPRPLAPSFAVAARQAQANGHLHLHLHAHVHAHPPVQDSPQDLPAPLETPAEPEPSIPNPLPATRSHTRRSSWHSWWQGD